MPKLRFFLLIFLAACLLASAACGSPASPAPTSSPDTSSSPSAPQETTAPAQSTQAPAEPTKVEAAPVKLVVFAYETPQGLMDPQIAEYQKLNPNVTIDYQVVPYEKYLETLRTMHEGGAQIDVMLVNGDSFMDILGFGLLLDVTDKVNYYDRFKEDLFYGTYYEVNGKRYGVPSGIGYFATYFYNKAQYDKYGIKVPTTFAELDEAGKTLSSNGVLPYALPGLFNLAFSQVTHFATDQFANNESTQFVRDTVAGRIPFTDPRWVKVYQCAVDWDKSGLFGKDYWGVDQSASEAAFAAGKAAMTMSGNWSFPAFLDAQKADPKLFELGMMLPPLCKDAPANVKPRADVFPGNMWGIYSGSKNVEESLKLMDFLSNDENAGKWMDFYKTNLSLNKNAKYSGEVTALDQQSVEFFDQGFTTPDWIMGLNLFTKFQEELVKVIRGEQTIEQGLANVEAYRVENKDSLPKY